MDIASDRVYEDFSFVAYIQNWTIQESPYVNESCIRGFSNLWIGSMELPPHAPSPKVSQCLIKH